MINKLELKYITVQNDVKQTLQDTLQKFATMHDDAALEIYGDDAFQVVFKPGATTLNLYFHALKLEDIRNCKTHFAVILNLIASSSMLRHLTIVDCDLTTNNIKQLKTVVNNSKRLLTLQIKQGGMTQTSSAIKQAVKRNNSYENELYVRLIFLAPLLACCRANLGSSIMLSILPLLMKPSNAEMAEVGDAKMTNIPDAISGLVGIPRAATSEDTTPHTITKFLAIETHTANKYSLFFKKFINSRYFHNETGIPYKRKWGK